MNRIKIINGTCPEQEREYAIKLTCVPTGFGTYLKGTIMCEYAAKNGCRQKECPIRKSHPEEFI